MQQNRYAFVDIGKLISIFLVIVLHACLGCSFLFQHIGSFNWWTTLAYYTGSRVCVPLLIMFSAVLTLWNDIESDPRHDIQKVRKRVTNFILPMVLWSLFYIVVFGKSIDMLSIARIFYAPTGLVHLWFLYVLIGIYLLSPLFLVMMRSGRRDLISYILLLWFLFSSLSVYVLHFFHVNLSYSYGVFPTYQAGFVGYYLLGAWLMGQKPLARRWSVVLVVTGYLLSMVLTAYDNLVVTHPQFTDRYLNFLAPGVVMMSAGCFEFLRSIKWSHKSFLTFLSPLVFGVYFVHEALLVVTRETFGWTGEGHMPLWMIPAIAMGVTLVSFILSAALSKTQGKRRIFF